MVEVVTQIAVGADVEQKADCFPAFEQNKVDVVAVVESFVACSTDTVTVAAVVDVKLVESFAACSADTVTDVVVDAVVGSFAACSAVVDKAVAVVMADALATQPMVVDVEAADVEANDVVCCPVFVEKVVAAKWVESFVECSARAATNAEPVVATLKNQLVAITVTLACKAMFLVVQQVPAIVTAASQPEWSRLAKLTVA